MWFRFNNHNTQSFKPNNPNEQLSQYTIQFSVSVYINAFDVGIGAEASVHVDYSEACTKS